MLWKINNIKITELIKNDNNESKFKLLISFISYAIILFFSARLLTFIWIILLKIDNIKNTETKKIINNKLKSIFIRLQPYISLNI